MNHDQSLWLTFSFSFYRQEPRNLLVLANHFTWNNHHRLEDNSEEGKRASISCQLQSNNNNLANFRQFGWTAKAWVFLVNVLPFKAVQFGWWKMGFHATKSVPTDLVVTVREVGK